MTIFPRAALLAALFLATPCVALADINVSADNGSVWQTKKAGDSTQGFLQIHNTGSSPDVLTGWTCSVANTTVLVDANGTALQSLTIPANQTVTLAPNGPHFLLQNLRYTVEMGSVVPCSLTFQSAGDVGGYLNAVPAPAK